MPAFGTLSSTQDMPSGTLILNGTSVPTDATGNNGDFYMDTTGKVLYGPKSATGVDQYAMNPATAPAVPTQGPNSYTLGLRLRFLVPLTVTGLRYYRSSAATVASRTLTLYRNLVLVATVTSPGETGTGWKTIPLTTPVAVDTGVDYVTAYYTAADYYAESGDGPPPSASPTQISNLSGCYGIGAATPENNVPVNYYFADLAFKAKWPIAIKSA